jgi:hypothetical protein
MARHLKVQDVSSWRAPWSTILRRLTKAMAWKLDRETNNQAGMLLRQEVSYGGLYRSGRKSRGR